MNLNLNYNSSATFICDILEILGQCCPQLQYCELRNLKLHATDIQIDTFTKGCISLKSLKISMRHDSSGSNVFHKLFHSLGRYNPALEELKLYDSRYENNDNLSTAQSISLQSLSNGCPLLHTLDLYGFKNLSISDISYFLNHATKLRKLNIAYSLVCNDGGVITKDEGKLKHLKWLELLDNQHITDESIINIVKGCLHLEMIDIRGCSELTDTCLFSIAENCPNLNLVYL